MLIKTKGTAVVGVLALLGTLTACGETGTAEGAESNRPIEMIVPFGPGGGADQLGRAVSAEMGTVLDVDVPVINVDGATGSTGITKLLSGKPGESMAVMTQPMLSVVEGGTASYALDDVRGVCGVHSMPSAIFAADGTFDSWNDVLEAGGELKVATVGPASVDDIALAALSEEFGVTFRAVPYIEPSERYTALLGGDVDLMYEQYGDVAAYLDSGEFTPMVSMETASPEGYDDVPAASDFGIPEGVLMTQFRGLVVDADTSDDKVERLQDACEEASETDAMSDFNKSVYAEPDGFLTAGEFDALLEEQAALLGTQLDNYELR
ncbi:hypothetical protein FXB39_07980 [Nocardioides sp. BGMRC 2183]|nr:hypothetical protein FXB39_07980 [Nocardioides sp. BGMRC 2183]